MKETAKGRNVCARVNCNSDSMVLKGKEKELLQKRMSKNKVNLML